MPKALAGRMLFVCFRPRVQNQTNTVPFGYCMSTEFTTTNTQKQFQLPAKKKLFYILQDKTMILYILTWVQINSKSKCPFGIYCTKYVS